MQDELKSETKPEELTEDTEAEAIELDEQDLSRVSGGIFKL